MDYVYETLGPLRFQRLCQALIVKEYPSALSLPTSQADGGRDAFTRNHSSGVDVVFQVKYTENPGRVRDAAKWVVQAIEDEAARVTQLKALGLKRYVVLSNVTATATLGSGSVDRASQLLQQKLQVPVTCLWRDDIDRRVDSNPELKWAYPEIITGRDVLAILMQALPGSMEDPSDAMRACLRHQYEEDKEVRFKQVDLSNQLADLFVDVPIGLYSASRTRWDWSQSQALMMTVRNDAELATQASSIDTADEFLELDTVLSRQHTPESVGGAAFLLNARAVETIPLLVLEGAPGQGKSTLAQYLCQVHRARILGEDLAVCGIKTEHAANPLKVPLKADLRDVALWISGNDPFPGRQGLDDMPRTIEGFFAAQISTLSGGVAFDVARLRALVRRFPMLFVFDALDEVADIATRRQIVDQVTGFVRRLRDISSQLQVIVTSRPAAYANSPGFSRDLFGYAELRPLTPHLIGEYSTKWCRVKRFAPRERRAIADVLVAKLREQHMRDLARNPMQLTILLALIHTRGASLPDKRTALYDSYIDIFFSREAEKSSTVQTHRDLLLDIHRYLGWLLHSEAEHRRHKYRISRDRLIRELQTYLRHEGRNVRLAEELFERGLLRVLMLVSRVDGTYEFEVQPLREYFCARYLYETAPHSPVGSPRSGDKLDRFDALARNSYWLNVTRFYAGCFSKGELPALASSIDDMLSDPAYALSSQPRVLGATLLSDWVFAQHLKSMHDVARRIFDDIGLAKTAGNLHRHPEEPEVRLAEECGREELAARCKRLLEEKYWSCGVRDRITRLLATNEEPLDLLSWWRQHAATLHSAPRLIQWASVGEALGVFGDLDEGDTRALIARGGEDMIGPLLQGAAVALAQQDDLAMMARDAVLDQAWTSWAPPPRVDPFGAFASCLNIIWTAGFEVAHGLTALVGSVGTAEVDTSGVSEVALECATYAVEMSRAVMSGRPVTLHGYSGLVEEGRGRWGERWVFNALAALGAVGKWSVAQPEDTDLTQHDVPAVLRAAKARQKARNVSWWGLQCDAAAARTDKMFLCVLLLVVAAKDVLTTLLPRLDHLLEGLSERDFDEVCRVASLARWWSKGGRMPTRIPSGLGARALFALAVRSAYSDEGAYVLEQLGRYDGDDSAVRSAVTRARLMSGTASFRGWPAILKYAHETVRRGACVEMGEIDLDGMPEGVATTILRAPWDYPPDLFRSADRRISLVRKANVRPLSSTADSERWFVQLR